MSLLKTFNLRVFNRKPKTVVPTFFNPITAVHFRKRSEARAERLRIAIQTTNNNEKRKLLQAELDVLDAALGTKSE